MSALPRLLLIDDDESIRWVLERALREQFSVVACADVAEARRQLARQRPALVLSDVRLPGEDGVSFLRELKREQPQLPVVLMTAHADLNSTVAAFEAGAFEFIAKPFDLDELQQVLQRALPKPEPAAALAEPGEERAGADIIGRSPAMQPVFRAIGRIARSPFAVLILGESGTGKELIARAVHRHSPRAAAPFVALNMAAIPQDLIEAELFGYEKGAFTGAQGRQSGRFEQAEGGTLFLDEIGDMPLPAQTRLLRVLSEGGYYRVGGTQQLRADVRVIAATHQNLAAQVEAGRFREDLFHRLNVVRIDLPPLRARREDIPLLTEHFLARAAAEAGLPRKQLASEVVQRLAQLPWPGNVRQLENLCRYLTVMVSGEQVQWPDVPADIRDTPLPSAASGAASPGDWRDAVRSAVLAACDGDRPDSVQAFTAELEQLVVSTVLGHTGGHRQDAARLLGWGRNTLTRYLKGSADTGT